MNNLVFLIGRLTKDCELKNNEKGLDICKFNIAVTRSFKNSNGNYDTDFISCTTFSQTAKTMAHYCKKGDLIGVFGRIQVRDYEKNGEKHYLTEIIAEKIRFLASNSKQTNTTNEPKQDINNMTNDQIVKAVVTEEDPFAEFGAEVQLSDDDLPF